MKKLIYNNQVTGCKTYDNKGQITVDVNHIKPEFDKSILYTQAAFARKLGVSRQRINKMVKDNQLPTLAIIGATLIKENHG